MKQLLTLILLSISLSVAAQTDSVAADTMPGKRNLIRKVIDYVAGNNEQPDTLDPYKMRWLFLGGPHYSSEEKFGLVLSGILSFRLKGCDPQSQKSEALLFSDFSTAGFWNIGLQGNIYFPNDSRRIQAETSVRYSPYDFWGIGFEKGDTDSLKDRLHQREFLIDGSITWRLADGLYLGPRANFRHISSGDLDRPELLEGQRQSFGQFGLGFTLLYDTRDYINYPSKGLIIQLNQLFHPRFIGNHYPFYRTDFRASIYRSVWRGGIIAGDLRTMFNFGSPSWASLALLGGKNAMRGYYTGRYRDRHIYTAQVELRQRIWKRNGIVAWVGVGNVFHDWNSFKAHILPNYGIGYRWELRPRMNIRLDVGFGKSRQYGFTFSMYEAF